MSSSTRLLAVLFSLILIPAVGACGSSNGGGGGDGGGGGGNGDGGGGGGGNGDGGGGGDSACRHLDLVFAVDGSSSMNEEMQAMSNTVFPGFADALLNISGGLDDYRVGTLDACPDPATFNTTGEPAGPSNQDNGTNDCNFASGKGWIEATSSTAANQVKSEFQCVGAIDRVVNDPDNGITTGNCAGNSDDERPTQAAITALSGAANPGFVRDNAVLVVIAITDEDEHTLPDPDTSAQDLYDQLVAIKGDVKREVYLGIGGSQSCDGAYGHADQATKLHDVANLFIAQQRGVWWNLCDGNLGDGLSQALDVIEQACDELPPVD